MTGRGALALALVTIVGAAGCQVRSGTSGAPHPASGSRPGAADTGPRGSARDAIPRRPGGEAAHHGGLSPSVAFVTVYHGRPAPLAAAQTETVLAAVWRLLGAVDTLAPQPDGPRLLANLRLNEYLVDVTIWHPQPLDVAGRRLAEVSGIVIPFTGPWRNRVLIVRGGAVEASSVLLENADLATLERVVDAAGGHS